MVATNAGLLARYERFDLIERCATTSPEPPPPAMTRSTPWVILVPSTNRDERPAVDGHPVPVVTAGQWTRIPTAWLTTAA